MMDDGSYLVCGEVLHRRDIPHSAKLIFFSVVTEAVRAGKPAVQVNITRISTDIGISRQTGAAALRALTKAGLLTRACETGNSYSVRTDLYRQAVNHSKETA